MKKILTAAIAAAALALPGAGLANEITAECEAYVAEHGGDASRCSCLGEAAAEDPAVAEALAMIDTPEDLEAADPAVKETIAACFPDSGQG